MAASGCSSGCSSGCKWLLGASGCFFEKKSLCAQWNILLLQGKWLQVAAQVAASGCWEQAAPSGCKLLLKWLQVAQVAASGSQKTPPACSMKAITHKSFYTQTLLHRDAFTHRRVCTQKLLHTEAFTHKRFFTHRHCYTQTLLHTEAFAHRRFYTQKLLHTDAFTHRRFYTQPLSHTPTYRQTRRTVSRPYIARQ